MGTSMNNAIVEVAGLGKSYVSARTGEVVEALVGIDLEVRQGEFLAIVGPSGCGKSTLLSLTAGFIQPSVGEIRFKGVPVAGPSDFWRSWAIAYSAQVAAECMTSLPCQLA